MSEHSVTSRLVESCKPFKVRASCGHIVIRKMREATAGVAYTEDVVLEAPRGRACDECEAMEKARSGEKAEYTYDVPSRRGPLGTAFLRKEKP